MPNITPNSPLTPKQSRFVDEYLLDMCATKAALRSGYPRANAKAVGWQNLQKPHIKAAIDSAVQERRVRTGIEADRVIREMAIIAFSDIRDIQVDADGKVDVLVPESARAIQELTVDRTESKVPGRRGRGAQNEERTEVKIRSKIKMYNKQAALGTLMTHLGLLHAELPPLEVLFNRLPPHVAALLRARMANPRPPAPPPLQVEDVPAPAPVEVPVEEQDADPEAAGA